MKRKPKPSPSQPNPAAGKRPPKKTAPAGEKYELRACGYSLEVTSHRLTKAEVAVVKEWCSLGGLSPDDMPGSLEEVLPEYNCYDTNRTQCGSLPTAGLLKFFVLDGKGREVCRFGKIGGSPKDPSRLKGSRQFSEAGGRGNILVYFEESKGTAATWFFVSETEPKPSDFSFRVGQVVVGKDSSEHIESAYYRGVEIERDYEGEDLCGKAAYSRLI